jgi:hypothetical protein
MNSCIKLRKLKKGVCNVNVKKLMNYSSNNSKTNKNSNLGTKSRKLWKKLQRTARWTLSIRGTSNNRDKTKLKLRRHLKGDWRRKNTIWSCLRKNRMLRESSANNFMKLNSYKRKYNKITCEDRYSRSSKRRSLTNA